MYDREASKKGALLERTTMSGTSLSQAGKPPHSCSPQMYGARSEHDVQADFLGEAKVLGDIVPASEIPLALGWLELVPEDVGEDGVEAHGAGLVEAVVPVLVRDPLGIHLATDDAVWLSIEEEVSSIPSERRVGSYCCRAGNQSNCCRQEGEAHGCGRDNRDSSPRRFPYLELILVP